MLKVLAGLIVVEVIFQILVSILLIITLHLINYRNQMIFYIERIKI